MSIFKACDIRGIAGSEITPDLFRRMGRGIALMMGDHRAIVVGGDLRVSTPELKATLIQGLCENGRRASDIGAVPTPVVYFAKAHLGAHACAVVTASHNPSEDNGLKFMVGELPVLPEDLKRLRTLVEGPETDAPVGTRATATARPDVLPAYEKWVASLRLPIDHGESAKVRRLIAVVDAGNGSYAEIAPRVIEERPGIQVDRLFCVPDGRFPNRDPNCALPESLSALSARVREVKANIGIAFDGDGDRVAFVDERGRVISPDEMMVLFLRALGERIEGERFVYDLKCSRIVAREAERLGATPLMEKSGHAFIKRRMIAEHALFGGEVSGHYFHRALHGGDDGLVSAMLGIRLLRQSDRPLSALRQTVPRRFITDDVRLPYPAGRVEGLLQRVRAAFPEERRLEIDGIRVSFPRGWGLLRASITEPKITLRFEGEDAASLREVMDAFLAPISELQPSVHAAIS